MLYAVRSTKSYSGLPLYFASNNIINYNNYKILVGKLHSTIDGRTTTTTTTTKKLLAMLAAGILVTGATFFAVPPQQKAFADHEGIEHDNNDEEQQADLDIEVFDAGGMGFDKLSAGFHAVSHQDIEQFVGHGGFLYFHFQQRA